MEHLYTSTACQHELHSRCIETCKFCDAPCGCQCHSGKRTHSHLIDRLCRAVQLAHPSLPSGECIAIAEAVLQSLHQVYRDDC